jgi:Putative Flp pilus-assembly TadE/G-like
MSRLREDRGAVAVLVAIMMTALLGLLAIVVDLGLAQDGRRRAQSAADSAALAAATQLSIDVFGAAKKTPADAESDAVKAVKAYALSNAGITDAAWASCTDFHPLLDTPDLAIKNTCISFDGTQARVILPVQASPVSFGGLFGAGPIDISAVAVAQWATTTAAAATTCWLCVQSQHTSVGLNAADGQVSLDAGDIRVGTTGAATLSITSGSVATTTGQIGYTGSPPTKGTGGSYSPAPLPVSSASAEPDPPAPALGPLQPNPSGYCLPGVYANITQCTNFHPGTYVVTGSNVFTGSASLATDAGTTFYLTCTDGSAAVPCRGAANTVGGSLTWSRLTSDLSILGPASGMRAAVVVDPRNTAQQRLVDTSAYRGTSRDNVTVVGGIDAPGSQLVVAARNHRFTPTAWNSVLLDVTGQITADRLTVSGLGARLNQHGTPPSGSSGSATQTPVRLVQ